jgi:hypothetical protein
MPINTNFIVEEIDGVRCSVVEKACTPERAAFLTDLLTFNGYTVHSVYNEGVVKLGVTDVTFDPVYMQVSRLLRRKDGKVVTKAYWKQVEEPIMSGGWKVRQGRK